MLWVLIRIASLESPRREAVLTSTHNIGFYEDLTKIIFELSSNIIKYAPYFFCSHDYQSFFCQANGRVLEYKTVTKNVKGYAVIWDINV